MAKACQELPFRGVKYDYDGSNNLAKFSFVSAIDSDGNPSKDRRHNQQALRRPRMVCLPEMGPMNTVQRCSIHG
jgi:hypothetical protein